MCQKVVRLVLTTTERLMGKLRSAGQQSGVERGQTAPLPPRYRTQHSCVNVRYLDPCRYVEQTHFKKSHMCPCCPTWNGGWVGGWSGGRETTQSSPPCVGFSQLSSCSTGRCSGSLSPSQKTPAQALEGPRRSVTTTCDLTLTPVFFFF